MTKHCAIYKKLTHACARVTILALWVGEGKVEGCREGHPESEGAIVFFSAKSQN